MRNSEKLLQATNHSACTLPSYWLIGITFLIVISSCKNQNNISSTPTSGSTSDYIIKYRGIAVKEMKRSNIPASITLAQGILESNSGNSFLAREGNNHFGIKCHNWQGKKIYEDDDKKHECFRKYNSPYESYRDHTDFLMRTPRYRNLFDYEANDYKSWAKGLKKNGYATNPKYASLLIDLIERYQLSQYDTKNAINKIDDIKEKNNDENKSTNIEEETESLGTRQIKYNNNIRYIIAKSGDSYISIAKELGILPNEIFKYNDLPKDASIAEGQIIYVQPKRNKAEFGFNTHKVIEGETMYTIAQKYGIKLERLYQINTIKRGEKLEPGRKLNLRDFSNDNKEEQSFKIEY